MTNDLICVKCWRVINDGQDRIWLDGDLWEPGWRHRVCPTQACPSCGGSGLAPNVTGPRA